MVSQIGLMKIHILWRLERVCWLWWDKLGLHVTPMNYLGTLF